MNTTAQFPRMHVSLYVKELDKTVAFYEKFFNRAPEKVKPGYAKFLLEQPALIISFVENPNYVQPAFGHLGIQVETPAEMEQKLQIATEAGFTIKEEMGTNCCYAKQDKFWISDPDGFRWEIYYFHEDVAFNDPHYATESAEACCIPEQVQDEPKPKVKLSLKDLSQKPSNGTSCEPGSGCC